MQQEIVDVNRNSEYFLERVQKIPKKIKMKLKGRIIIANIRPLIYNFNKRRGKNYEQRCSNRNRKINIKTMEYE